MSDSQSTSNHSRRAGQSQSTGQIIPVPVWREDFFITSIRTGSGARPTCSCPWLTGTGVEALARRHQSWSLELVAPLGFASPQAIVEDSFADALSRFDPDQGIFLARFTSTLWKALQQAPCNRNRPRAWPSFLRRCFAHLRRHGANSPVIKDASWLSEWGQEQLAVRHYGRALAWLDGRGIEDPAAVAIPAFLKMCSRFDPDRGAFAALFWSRLRFDAATAYRRQKNRLALEPLSDGWDAPGIESAPFSDREALDTALTCGWQELDVISRRVVWLRFAAGFSFEEVQQQPDFVGCPLRAATLRCRYARAWRILAPHLAPFDDASIDDLIESMHRVADICASVRERYVKRGHPSRDLRRPAAKSGCASRRTKGVRRKSLQHATP